MEATSAAVSLLSGEARALLTRLDRVKPFALHETMVPAAAPTPEAQVAVERFLITGRTALRRRVEAYLTWLAGPGRTGSPELAQRRFTTLRRRFNDVLTQFDLYQEAVTQRSERDIGVWLAGLDVAAADALGAPRTPLRRPPPLITYLDHGPGAAIRRVNTRIPGGDRTPVALIRIPRERMVGYGIGASLVHEVGHQAAALLGLVDSLRPALLDAELTGRGPAERAAFAYWGLTISEIVADFWSVGQLGVAGTLGLMGVVSLPRRFVFTALPDDPHPLPYIRVRLSCAMGDALYPHPQWRALGSLWSALYPPTRLPEELRRLIGALESTMPRFVDVLLNHRPPALGGSRLGDVMPLASRRPEQLAARHAHWVRRPDLLRSAPPTLVFAVLGQARAAALISPEEESRLLGDVITHWALSSTLAGITRCAGAPAVLADSSTS
ncbi:hypothetical protein G5C60_49285 [Streptomyces sp. HC44]|uniref:Uncharacterized protein n=1 Tax=Streptomyces scabichelini TaxID=2711217 RepID=A0A6G4VNJ4_9ACTN|nr:hypothetical protein [Streptomyces scabichelini]NGO15370.1 hypothetical protein [Streptomyces scabichelini]